MRLPSDGGGVVLMLMIMLMMVVVVMKVMIVDTCKHANMCVYIYKQIKKHTHIYTYVHLVQGDLASSITNTLHLLTQAASTCRKTSVAYLSGEVSCFWSCGEHQTSSGGWNSGPSSMGLGNGVARTCWKR